MTAFACTTFILLGVIYIDLRPKWQAGNKKTFFVASAFLLAGYVILTLSSFGFEVYSPLQPLIDLIGRLTGQAL